MRLKFSTVFKLKKTFSGFAPKFVQANIARKKQAQISGFLIKEEDLSACENDAGHRDAVLASQMEKFPKQRIKTERLIKKEFERNPRLKDYVGHEKEEIMQDMRFCRFAYGFAPDEYMYQGLFDEVKEPEKRREFLSETERLTFRCSVNNLFKASTLTDKASAYSLLKKYYKRDVVKISGQGDYNAYLRFVAAHDTFVLKYVYDSQGHSVFLVRMSEQKSEKEFFEKVLNTGKAVLEELIYQSDIMAAFNKDSVNTIRIFTFLTKHGVVTPFAFFKTGRKGRFVDNGGAGGIFADIDSKTGVVSSDACDEMGNRFVTHPDSGVKYRGFQLPEWESAVDICKEAALVIPEVKYLGWDLAYTDDKGWVVVEVNTSGAFIQQGCRRKGIKKELAEVAADMDMIVPYTFRI